MLREKLSQDQLRLLEVIFEPFDQDRGWPVWQYVDLTLEARFGLEAGAVLDSLPVVGYHSPMSMSYGLTWREDSYTQPKPGAHIALTVAGLQYLRPATDGADREAVDEGAAHIREVLSGYRPGSQNWPGRRTTPARPCGTLPSGPGSALAAPEGMLP